MPHTAITPSPMCLSMWPPCSTITASKRVHTAFITPAIVSGSTRDDIDVNPLTSANSTVACRRRCGSAPAPSNCSRSEATAASTTSSGTTPRKLSCAAIARSSC
jgi:hypothetical protein